MTIKLKFAEKRKQQNCDDNVIMTIRQCKYVGDSSKGPTLVGQKHIRRSEGS